MEGKSNLCIHSSHNTDGGLKPSAQGSAGYPHLPVGRTTSHCSFRGHALANKDRACTCENMALRKATACHLSQRSWIYSHQDAEPIFAASHSQQDFKKKKSSLGHYHDPLGPKATPSDQDKLRAWHSPWPCEGD